MQTDVMFKGVPTLYLMQPDDTRLPAGKFWDPRPLNYKIRRHSSDGRDTWADGGKDRSECTITDLALNCSGSPRALMMRSKKRNDNLANHLVHICAHDSGRYKLRTRKKQNGKEGGENIAEPYGADGQQHTHETLCQ